LRFKDENCTNACDTLYEKMEIAGIEVLYDDRDAGAGAKFANMDLIGVPWQVVVGPKGLEKGVLELKNRRTGERVELSEEELLAKLG